MQNQAKPLHISSYIKIKIQAIKLTQAHFNLTQERIKFQNKKHKKQLLFLTQIHN